MRAFIAVDLGTTALAALAEAQAALRRATTARRWTELAGAHVTLHFLGEVDAAMAEAVAAAIARQAAGTAPFELALAPIGAFPDARRPRVLWAGLGGDVPALAALQAALGAELRALGLPPEDRAYRPHVTLAREPRAFAEVPVPPVAWRVDEVVLYRSHLGPAGPRYEPLARHPLAGRGLAPASQE